MTQKEALLLALEVLQNLEDTNSYWWQEVDEVTLKQMEPAINAIKAALANEALERKAENARELGLDYEPWEKFCDSNCVWTDHHPDCKLAEQKPVAWMNGWGDLFKNPDEAERGQTMRPLYVAPPQRKPLTDEEIDAIVVDEVGLDADADEMHNFARAIEAAHGIKGEAK